MSSHVLVLSIPTHGHMRPQLALAEELVRRGHRVSFLTSESFEPAVRETGATPFVHKGRLDDVLGNDRYDTMTPDMLARSAVLFLQESTELVPVAQRLFADDLPDLVLYDMIVAPAGRALEQLWRRPAVQSTPSLASNAHYSEVRETSEDAGVTRDHPAVVELFTKARQFTDELGIDIAPDALVSWGADRSVVYVPREFQPFGETFGEETAFVGPCMTSQYAAAEPWAPPADGLPLVVVSMGSLYNRQPEFFSTCVRAFEGRPWHAVITVGASSDPADLGPLPSNVEVHSWIPQLAALRRADVFVTAAGLGSLMESLYAGTPPVLVPQMPETRVLSKRAVALGLGTLLPPAEVTEETLLEAVRTTAADTAMRERVARMSTALERAGGTPRAAEAIEALL